MRAVLRRKYRKVRKEFKADMWSLAETNKAFVIMIIETYVASRNKRHIMKVWELLSHYPAARREYFDNLWGGCLTGRSEMLRNLAFVDRGLYEKYYGRIPERFAMGDALAVAYRALKVP